MGGCGLSGRGAGVCAVHQGTAYLFAPWPLMVLLPRKKLVPGALAGLAIAAAINTPQYLRNYELSGSIMGFDSVEGDGFFAGATSASDGARRRRTWCAMFWISWALAASDGTGMCMARPWRFIGRWHRCQRSRDHLAMEHVRAAGQRES